jgi:hypothetical protein
MAIEHYDDKFFKVRKGYMGRVPIMCQGIVDIWKPKTLIDLGAAIGDTVQGYIDRGVDAKGIEGSDSCLPYLICAPDKISIQDLSKPLDPMPEKVDVVTCFEVIEHIEPEFIDTMMDNIIQLSDVLVISICCYGPTTKIHPSIKPTDFWLEEFIKRGFERKPEKEEQLKQIWKPIEHKAGIKEPYKNLMVWERKSNV